MKPNQPKLEMGVVSFQSFLWFVFSLEDGLRTILVDKGKCFLSAWVHIGFLTLNVQEKIFGVEGQQVII